MHVMLHPFKHVHKMLAFAARGLMHFHSGTSTVPSRPLKHPQFLHAFILKKTFVSSTCAGAEPAVPGFSTPPGRARGVGWLW